jgi:hypothetical protein
LEIYGLVRLQLKSGNESLDEAYPVMLSTVELAAYKNKQRFHLKNVLYCSNDESHLPTMSSGGALIY